MTSESTTQTDAYDALQQMQEDAVESAPVQETDPVAALTADLQRLQA